MSSAGPAGGYGSESTGLSLELLDMSLEESPCPARATTKSRKRKADEIDLTDDSFEPRMTRSLSGRRLVSGSGGSGSNATGNASRTLTIKGIIGTDAHGNTFIPQKLSFVFNSENREHSALVDRAMTNNLQEWRATGCSCATFSTSFKVDFAEPSVLSGITRNFKMRTFPDKKEFASKEAKRGRKQA